MSNAPQRHTWTTGGDATMTGVLRPDGRLPVTLPEQHPHAWAALVTVAAQDAPGPLLVSRPADDPHEIVARLQAAGFHAGRTETTWQIPVHPLTAMRARTPHELLRVTELDLDAVATLDNTVRADIPGSDHWRGTAHDLQETLADPEFDPELYLIARDPRSGSLDGLVRVWNRSPTPRLGCLGVTRAWRRTSLAGALVKAVAQTLHGRGVTHIVTETDDTNADSALIAANYGGVAISSTVEWERA